MREHTIVTARKLVEARIRKMVPTRKVKSTGSKQHSLNQVIGLLKARIRSGKAIPGTYFFSGVKLHVGAGKQVILECPRCSQMFGEYIDFADHLEDRHTSG